MLNENDDEQTLGASADPYADLRSKLTYLSERGDDQEREYAAGGLKSLSGDMSQYSESDLDEIRGRVDGLYDAARTRNDDFTPEERKTRMNVRFDQAQKIGEKLKYVVEQNGDDESVADETEWAKGGLKFLSSHSREFDRMSDADIAEIQAKTDELYGNAEKRRGHWQVFTDALKRGWQSAGRMAIEGGLMLKPGELTDEDRATIRALKTAGEQYDIAHPKRTGDIREIGSAGDVIDYVAELAGENAVRTGAAVGIGTIGAIAAPAVGATAAVGGVVGGALGGLAFNTGEAVEDQTDENLDVSRALALAQGVGYSALDTIGVVPVVGKLFGKAVAQAGKKAVGTALTQGLREVGKAAVVKGAAKELAKTAVEEGVGEAAQSQVVGRGRRYLQTGSALKEGETPGEAFWEGVNEFVGGLVMGATLGGGPIAANTAGARRKVGIARSIAGKMGADEAFQSLSPEYQMLVGRHLMNESLLATERYASVLSDEERSFLAAQNADIEKDLQEDENAGAARAVLDGMTTAYKLESKEAVVEAARANGEASNIDFQAIRDTEHEIESQGGKRVLAYYDKGTKQHLYRVVNGQDVGKDVWLLTPPQGVKASIDGETAFGDLPSALKAMEDNDIYNRYVAKNSGSKRSVIKQMVEKMYNGEVNLEIADGALALNERMRGQYVQSGGFAAAYDPDTNTLHVLTDKIKSLGQLYTVIAHEGMHKEIADYIKDSGRDKVDGGDLKAGRKRLFSGQENGGFGERFGVEADEAGEEVIVERASVEKIVNALQSQDRTLVGEGVSRVVDAVKRMMGEHTGFTANAITDADVREELSFLLDRGDFGIKATVNGGNEVASESAVARGERELADQESQERFKAQSAEKQARQAKIAAKSAEIKGNIARKEAEMADLREKTDYQSVLDRDEMVEEELPSGPFSEEDKLIELWPKSYAKFLSDLKLKDDKNSRKRFFDTVQGGDRTVLVDEGASSESDENGATGVPGEKGTTSRPEAAKPVDKPNPSPAKPSRYGNEKQTAFFKDWMDKKPEGTTLIGTKLNEKGALVIRSTDADGKTTDTYVSKDGVSFVESAKVVNKHGKVLAGTAAQHAIDTKEESKARRVFAEENPGMAEFNYFVDRGEWLIVYPGSMMVRNRNGKGFHKEFMGGVDAEALNQILDGFKGKDRENVENILFGRDHRTSVKSTANDEVLENFIKSTGGDPKDDPRAHDYEGFIRRFLDQYAEYEEWKKNGMKTKEQIAAENAEAEAKAREVKVGGDSYDIENLAEEVTSRELYDTALAEVEQNGEAVQMFGRGELKKLNGGDIIRFDHADSDWIVESYDDAAGEIVVTANDIADNPLFTDEEKKELTGRRFRITERGWVELKTKETKNGTESKTGKGTDETVAGNAQGERKAGGEDLKLESASQKELNDEQKRNAQRKAVAEKQSAPLKGGTGEVGQTLMDLGGAEGEDLFNRTQKSEQKPGVSKTETTTSTAEKRSEVPTVEEAKAAAKVLGMDAYIPDESLKRKIAGWTRGADKSPLWKAKVDAAKVILADRAAKGKADAKSTESVIKNTESVSKKTESVSKKRENVSSDTENVSPKGEKLQKSEKTSTAKIIPSENTTPTDEGFAAWAVDRDGNPLEFATDSDRKLSRDLFDRMVKRGIVDGKTGKSSVRFKRADDAQFKSLAEQYGTTDDFGDALLLTPVGKLISSRHGKLGHNDLGDIHLSVDIDKFLEEHPDMEDAYDAARSEVMPKVFDEFRRRGEEKSTARASMIAAKIANAKIIEGRTITVAEAIEDRSGSVRGLLDAGGIRIDSNNGGIELSRKPTGEQEDRLYDFVDWQEENSASGEYAVDLHDGDRLVSVRYSVKTPARKLLDDIRAFYDDGTVPVGIEDGGLSQFYGRFKRVTDKSEIARLDNDPKGYTYAYASAQMIDGKIHSPMAAYVDGKLTEAFPIGEWTIAEERPDLIKNGKFKLSKSGKSADDINAAYNPYWHSVSLDSPLNDQFAVAYRRPNMVMIKVKIPNSDLDSGYKAKYAKDPVGKLKWKNGEVSDALAAAGKPPREVYLSRYRQVVEVLSDDETARLIAKQLEGVDVELPANVVTPSVRDILVNKYGVKLGEPTGNANQKAKYKKDLEDQGVRFKRTADGSLDYEGEFNVRFKRTISTAGKYAGELRKLAHGMKRGDMKSLLIGADMMSPLIPQNAVIVPMPNHEGKPIRTMLLGYCISGVRDDVDVVPALLANPHEGSYHDKKIHKRPNVTMHRDESVTIPEGRPVVVIDNVIASGATWAAAQKVLPDADLVTLADARRKAAQDLYKSDHDFVFSKGEWEYAPKWTAPRLKRAPREDAIESNIRQMLKHDKVYNPNDAFHFAYSASQNEIAFFHDNGDLTFDIIARDKLTPDGIERVTEVSKFYRTDENGENLDKSIQEFESSVRLGNVGDGGKAKNGTAADDNGNLAVPNKGNGSGQDRQEGVGAGEAGSVRLKRAEQLPTAAADDPNVVFGSKDGIFAKTGLQYDFERIGDRAVMDAGAEIARDSAAVNAIIDKVTRGDAPSSTDLAALIHAFADKVVDLNGLRNSMDAQNGKDRANEEAVLDAASERLIEGLRLAGSRSGHALQMLKIGIGLSGLKDNYYYLASEVRAIKARQGLDPMLTDAERKMLEEQAAKLKELNDNLNAELAKRDTRIADLEAMNRQLIGLRKQTERKISEAIKKQYGIKDSTSANIALSGFGKFFTRAEGARLARSGGARITLNDELRKSCAAALYSVGMNETNARNMIRETFGDEAAAVFDEYLAEIGGVSDREQVVRGQRDEAAKSEDGRLAQKKARLDRKRNDAIRALDEADDDLDARRKAIAKYLRDFMKYIVEADPSLSNEDVLQRMADEASAIDPRGKYDATEMLSVVTGRRGFDMQTREATEKRMGELMKALELARKGLLEDAARVAGIPYRGGVDRLEKMERDLKRMLREKDDRLMDLLANPPADKVAQVEEINRLKAEIAETVEMIRMMRKEIAESEKRQRMIEMLTKQLEARQNILSELGEKNDPERKARLDGEIETLRRSIKSVNREISIQRSLNDQIEELERRIRENDFETAPVRPRIERSPEVNALMARRDALRRQLQHQRKMYQYKKRPLPFQMAIDFVHILAESKAIVGSLDLSSMFRQGGQLTFAHPLLFVKNFKKTIEAFKSDDAAVKMMGEILSRPNAKYYKDSGIDFTDWGDGAMSADDRFELYNNAGEGRKLLDFYHKVVKSRYIKMGVNASERAFAMYLNLMRADAFDQIVRNSPFGDASKMNRSQLKALGNFINIASQRGSIEKGSNLGKAINWMNYFLWSPRNLISRFQFLYNTVKLATPGANPYGDKTLRGLFAKELVRYIAGVATTITFAKLMSELLKGDDEPPDEIEFDPRSSQFLRVKFGNTRVEFLSGLAQILTFSSRWFTGKDKNSRGQLRDTNFAEAFGKFVRTKLSPVASFFWDYSTGETFEHQDIVWDKPWANTKEEKAAYRHFAETFVPLTLTDLIEQGKYSGLDNTAVTAFLTILGAGVNAYDPLTYKQMTGDFHYYKRLYAESPEDERRRIELYHPMIRRAGAIEANIKRVNSLRTMLKKIEANGGDATAIRNAIERQQKVVINLISGAPNPSQVD